MLTDRLSILLRIGVPALLTWLVAQWVAGRAGLVWGLLVPFLPLVAVGLYQKRLQQRGDTFEVPSREETIGGIIFGAGIAFVVLVLGAVLGWIF